MIAAFRLQALVDSASVKLLRCITYNASWLVHGDASKLANKGSGLARSFDSHGRPRTQRSATQMLIKNHVRNNFSYGPSICQVVSDQLAQRLRLCTPKGAGPCTANAVRHRSDYSFRYGKESDIIVRSAKTSKPNMRMHEISHVEIRIRAPDENTKSSGRLQL